MNAGQAKRGSQRVCRGSEERVSCGGGRPGGLDRYVRQSNRSCRPGEEEEEKEQSRGRYSRSWELEVTD